jgi:hypothetical protein
MKIRILIGALALVALFQNCAEPLNPDDYADQSSTGTPTTPAAPQPEPPPTTPPPVTPPPVAPPTGTTITITAQSAPTTNLTEGQNIYLYVTSVKSPADALVAYEWRKGTTVIASGASAAATYQKTAAVVADTGAYQVFVKDAVTNVVLAQSQVFNVTVSPAVVSYNPATLTSGTITFYLSHAVADSIGTEADTVAAFCKAKHGAAATVARYAKLGNSPTNVYRAVYLKPGYSCGGYINLTNGICGYNVFALQWPIYSIDCRR